jgi:hypothetical protein
MSSSTGVSIKPYQGHETLTNKLTNIQSIINPKKFSQLSGNNVDNLKMVLNVTSKPFVPLKGRVADQIFPSFEKHVTLGDEYPLPMRYLFDDDEGVYFNYFFSYLKNKIHQIILNTPILALPFLKTPYKDKRKIVADRLHTEITKGHAPNSHLYLLTAFQICTYLPFDYRNVVWKLLAANFKDVSFENSCPFLDILQKASFDKKLEFNDILSLINILAFMHLYDRTEYALDYFTKSFGINLVSLEDDDPLKSAFKALIHFKTPTGAVTLEIPIENGCQSDSKIFASMDLIAPLFPELQVLCNLKPTKNILLLQFVNVNLFNLINHLLNSDDIDTVFTGLKLLLALFTNQYIDKTLFTSNLIRALPLLKEKQKDFNIILHFLKNLKVLPFQKECYILLSSAPPLSFISTYVNILTTHQSIHITKIGLEFWQKEMVRSLTQDQYGEELFDSWEVKDFSRYKNISICGLEIFKNVMKNHHTEMAVFCLEILINVVKSCGVFQELESLFILVYSNVSSETKTPEVLQKVFVVADTLTRFNPFYNVRICENSSSIFKQLILDLNTSLQPKLSSQLILNGLGNWIPYNDRATCPLVFQIAESLFDKADSKSVFEAFNFLGDVAATSLYSSDENKVKEHRFIQKLLLKIDQNDITFKNLIMELVPKLLEHNILTEIAKKFHDDFIAHLKNLCSLGAETEFTRLLKTGRIAITDDELAECRITLLSQVKDEIKATIVMQMEFRSLHPETKSFVETLSRQLCKRLLSSHTHLCLQLGYKILEKDEQLLFKLLKYVLEQQTISDSLQINPILRLVLTGKINSAKDKLCLLELYSQKVKKCHLTVKEAIREIHVQLQKDLKEFNLESISLLKVLLAIFSPKEIFPKRPEMWLEVLECMGENVVDLAFKDKIIRLLLEHKIIPKDLYFSNFRKISHALISEYIKLKRLREASLLLTHFQTFDIPHAFSPQIHANFYVCLTYFLTTKDAEKSFLLLKIIRNNNDSADDVRFLTALKSYYEIIYERNDFVKWIDTALEFFKFKLDPSIEYMIKPSLWGALQNAPQTNASRVLTYLTKTCCPDITLWFKLLTVVKEHSIRDLKMKLAEELKIVKFQNLFPLTTLEALKSWFIFLEFINDTNNILIAHKIFTNNVLSLYYSLLNKHQGFDTPQFEIIITVLRKLFQQLKEPAEKENLLTSLYTYHQITNYWTDQLEWSIKKVLLDACISVGTPLYFVVGISIIETFIPRLESPAKRAEIIKPFLEIAKKWPDFNEESIVNMIPEFKTVKQVFNTTPKVIIESAHNKFSDVQFNLFPESKYGMTFFEQFHNLIQRSSELLQLAALDFYSKSLGFIEESQNPSKLLRSSTNHIPNNKLIKLAFESRYPKVFFSAIFLFLKNVFQDSILIQDKYDFQKLILDKLFLLSLQSPVKSIEDIPLDKLPVFVPLQEITGNNDNLRDPGEGSAVLSCLFCLFFNTSLEKKKTQTLIHFNFFRALNLKILKELKNVDIYLKNHKWIFISMMAHLSVNKLKYHPTKSHPLVDHLMELWGQFKSEVIFNKAYLDLIYFELETLLKSGFIKREALCTPLKTIVFATNSIWDDHNVTHMNALKTIVPLSLNIEIYDCLHLLLYYKFYNRNSIETAPISNDEKIKCLIQMCKLIDENTPNAMLYRIVDLFRKFNLIFENLNDFRTCFTLIAKEYNQRDKFQSDAYTLQHVVGLQQLLMGENNESLWGKFFKTDKLTASLLLHEYAQTLYNLGSHLVENEYRILYFKQLLEFISKNAVSLNSQDYLTHISICFDISVELEKDHDNTFIHKEILKSFSKLVENSTSNRDKQKTLFVKFLNHYIDMSTQAKYKQMISNKCLSLINELFHNLYKINDSAFRPVGDLISQLKNGLLYG